ncbi:MarR family winged helix-turn-helix transcriptional regulator [Actinoplanes sp. RD1]|uniref:MarR family winged helix-turn-helix transcriptional regulator n=1 Tax=Actinoplanes sp. RD1 TaxID=3064538 RepID=UPI002740D8E8|nr:MarR family winged helix-turn-helix transcriptional regulator [Actinoplanes sp. RD1]
MHDEPRWLDEHELQGWMALASLIFKLPAALDAQLLRDNGLTLFDYMTVSALSMAPDRTMRLSDLAGAISASLSRLSNVVKRLEQRGLLRREPDPENARYTRAVLTDAGWDLVVAAAPGHVEAVRRYVIDGLTPEQIEVLRQVGCSVATRVSEGLAAARPPTPEAHAACQAAQADDDAALAAECAAAAEAAEKASAPSPVTASAEAPSSAAAAGASAPSPVTASAEGPSSAAAAPSPVTAKQ